MSHIIKKHREIKGESLAKRREIWNNKKILQKIYGDWYREMISDLCSGAGKTVELGSGTGNFKDFKPDIVTSDIEKQDWIDMRFDAHEMPFTENEIANFVMIDVLHHLADPIKFLNETYRVLEPGGRIILIEPYMSPFSKIVYKLKHHEPFDLKSDYFNDKIDINKDPWDSNQAIATILFFREIKKFNNLFANKFTFHKKKQISIVLFPGSGGYEYRQFIPNSLIPLFELIEKLLTPFSGLLAFRCYVVLEKK